MQDSRSVATRAAVGVALLVGFYVLVAAVIAGTIGLNVAIVALFGRIQAYVVMGSGLVIVALLRSVLVLERKQQDDDEGVLVTRLEEPALWALVDETAAAVGTRPPDEILLVEDVNAAVAELGGLLGLRRGRRRLLVGLGLLNALDVEQVRAVLAHEMGHYSGGDTRLGAVTYRGGASIGRAVAHLGQGTVLGRLFTAYARLYWRITLAVRRRQELNADTAAVRYAGRDPFTSSLRAVTAAAPAWDFLLGRYAAPVWERGAHPADLYAGLRAILADPARQEQLADVVAEAEQGATDRYDSHPSLGDRLAAAASLPEGPRPTGRPDDEPLPGRTLLRDAELAERAMSRRLAARAVGSDPGAATEWDEAGEVYGAGIAAEAHATVATLGRIDGTGTPTLRHFLDTLDSEAVLPLAVALAGDLATVPPQQHAEVRAAVVKGRAAEVLAAALVDQGRAAWRLSWSGPVEAVTPDGEPVDLGAAVERALDDDAMPALRDLLVDLRVDERWRPAAPPAPTRPVDELLAVVNDVHRAGRRCDLAVFADRFALVTFRLSPVDALVVGMASAMGGSARADGPFSRRCAELVRTPVDDLVARDPRNRSARWTDVVDARITRRAGGLGGWRLRMLLADGEVLDVKSLSASPPRKAVEALLRERLAAAGAAGAAAEPVPARVPA